MAQFLSSVLENMSSSVEWGKIIQFAIYLQFAYSLFLGILSESQDRSSKESQPQLAISTILLVPTQKLLIDKIPL